MVRILTQDVDPLATRKQDMPPKLCQVVDACLRRDRDQRIQGAGEVARQLEATLNEIKAVRYRSVGRRASDRAQGQFRRRHSDFASAGPNGGPPIALETPPPQRVVVLAAVLGAIFGVSATAILFLLMK
jgi:serine/threonine-protein kinase